MPSSASVVASPKAKLRALRPRSLSRQRWPLHLIHYIYIHRWEGNE